MSSFSAGELARIVNGKCLGDPSNTFSELYYDTRKIHSGEFGLFAALTSSHNNGHLFIPAARKAGIKTFLVSQAIEPLEGEAVVLVENSLKALQQLAAYHRNRFHYPVVGITGSYGKTVVKEWLSKLLSPEKQLVTNPRSFNSQLGVPLSVWQMDDRRDFGIFEAGISEQGEMSVLEAIIRPTGGLFLNLGEAHASGFEDSQAKAIEKSQLFKRAEWLVWNIDYPEIKNAVDALKAANPALKTLSFSAVGDEEADFSVKPLQELSTTKLDGCLHGIPVEASIPFTDRASIENAVACWAVMLMIGYLNEQAAPRLSQLEPVGMRMEQKPAINQCVLINDSYGNTMDALSVALEFFAAQNARPNKTIILSDLAETTVADLARYRWISRKLRASGVRRLIAVGPVMQQLKQYFALPEMLFFPSTEALLDELPQIDFYNEIILLKGARAFGFERIERFLSEERHRTVLEVNLDSLVSNYKYYRGLVPSHIKLMAMVKAFAYGSGLVEVASQLQYHGVNYLTVAYADEGVALRKAGIRLPIMVMNPEAESFDRMWDYQLEPELFSFRIFNQFEQFVAGKSKGEQFPIHLKIDTGMHRLGFMPDEVKSLAARIKSAGYFKVASVFSHLAASEDPAHLEFTHQQINTFKQATEEISAELGYTPLRHILNTAGISNYPEAGFDMVRLGIGLYGVESAGKNQHKLLQVGRLKTIISQIKSLEPGDTVGYGRVGKVTKKGQVATVAIGYADGVSRIFGNGRAHFYVNGKLAPTIGNICMDMCMIDVTGIRVQEGDEVILFGPERPIHELGAEVGMIPYELLTSISPRVKRIYVKE